MRAVKAILWQNGMTMVFDKSGQQMPEYQGEGINTIPKIRRDFPGLIIEGMDWHTDKIKGVND